MACDGTTDDTSALNAMFAAVPDFTELDWPSRCAAKITATINIHGKNGLRLIARSSPGSAAGENGTSFIWYGREGGTMISIDKSRGLWVEGFALFPKRGANSNADPIAYVGFDVDQTDHAFTGITTDIVFNRIFIALQGSSPNQSHFRGFQFSSRSSENVEDMTITNSTVICSPSNSTGVGVYVGFSFNSKGYQLNNVQLSYCSRGLELGNGSVSIHSCLTEHNAVDFYLHNWTEPVTIEGAVSENSKHFVVVDPLSYVNNAPLRIVGNKVAEAVGKPVAHSDICNGQCESRIRREQQDGRRCGHHFFGRRER